MTDRSPDFTAGYIAALDRMAKIIGDASRAEMKRYDNAFHDGLTGYNRLRPLARATMASDLLTAVHECRRAAVLEREGLDV